MRSAACGRRVTPAGGCRCGGDESVRCGGVVPCAPIHRQDLNKMLNAGPVPYWDRLHFFEQSGPLTGEGQS